MMHAMDNKNICGKRLLIIHLFSYICKLISITEKQTLMKKLILKELLREKYDKKNYHRFYYFENGEFVRMYDSVVNIE